MNDRQRDRLASETSEDRKARLQRISDRQCDRLVASETIKEKEERLQGIDD